jgi:glycosyltransferase involved in cell wall biosynthesis
MTDQMPVSVLILTLNEEVNLQRCIEAVRWSDDIVVLDSHSTDGTVGLAGRLGARVYQRAFDDFASQRNDALDKINFKHDWVLHLDADEVMTDELREEMNIAIRNRRYSAYRIAGKLIFNDKWLRYSGMYPVYQVRLGRKDLLRFRQAGHGQREAIDPDLVGTLKKAYLHYGFSKGLSDWVERHNRYSTADAHQNLSGFRDGTANLSGLLSSDQTVRRRALKVLATRLPFRSFLRFFYMYLLKMGFLDGKAGWAYCRMMAMFEYWTVLKEREIRRTKD